MEDSFFLFQRIDAALKSPISEVEKCVWAYVFKKKVINLVFFKHRPGKAKCVEGGGPFLGFEIEYPRKIPEDKNRRFRPIFFAFSC